MAHKFVIRKSEASGEYRAYFEYNSEKIFWTEGYLSKASAENAIDSIRSNGPNAPIEDETVQEAQLPPRPPEVSSPAFAGEVAAVG
jgi:hypothetical protein